MEMNAVSQGAIHDRIDQTVRHYLRTVTSTLHARVDGAFPDGLGDAMTYARYLVGMYRFAEDFEIATRVPPRHSLWLSQDLRALGLTPASPSIAQSPITDVGERVGWDYVMAGSSVGARQLVRGVRRLGHTPAHGACFLARHGESDDWAQVQIRLSAFNLNDGPCLARIERGARDAFACVATCFEQSVDVTPVQQRDCNA